MQLIDRWDIPSDFTDYWQSDEYVAYLESAGMHMIGSVGSRGYWITMKIFSFCKFVYADEEPSLSYIRSVTRMHGLVYWTPFRRINIPRGWNRVRRPFTTHCISKGFSNVSSDYIHVWNQRARRNIGRFFQSGCSVYEGASEEFKKGCALATFKPSFQRHYAQKVSEIPSHIRSIFICKKNDSIVGGLCVMRYANTSVHIASFLTKEGKNANAGTGLIDYWNRHAYKENLAYLHFGELGRQKIDDRTWQGFSDFKRNFIEYEVHFDDEYWRFF
ncbi:hypothetical protein HYW94_02265 [Candidatus Uhrbacteria bacterium]|nr:hypothetical protein [Candidatus Uhrbacteria bacterium]